MKVAAASGRSLREVALEAGVEESAVYVHGWQTLGGGTTSYTLFSWALGSTSAGNMTAIPTPGAATTGGAGSIALSFSSGLAAGRRYLGAVDYSNGSPIGSTIVYQKP